MDRKLTERRFPSEEVISAYNTITDTEETFMRSLQDPDKAIAASSSVVSLQQAGVDATAEQLELENGSVTYQITTDGKPENLTDEDLEKLVDVTDRYKPELTKDGKSFVLQED